MLYKKLVRPALFRVWGDPESAHEFALEAMERAQLSQTALRFVRAACGGMSMASPTNIGSLTFPNVIGLAAGFDKNARVVPFMQVLGFGFVTTGTFTPRPQQGHERPRIWRDVSLKAIFNRMGFPNEGAAMGSARLRAMRARGDVQIPVGASIGMQKDTPIEQAVDDYLTCIDHLFGLVDYFEINVSSPNTTGLRDLQATEQLQRILSACRQRITALSSESGVKPPDLWLKIAPDINKDFIREVVEVAVDQNVAAIVAGNTTVSREPGDLDHPGGKSGRPLFPLALEKVRMCADAANGRLAVVGAGGISSAPDVIEMQMAGAKLIQLYTGLIYEGPRLPGRINRHLLDLTGDS